MDSTSLAEPASHFKQKKQNQSVIIVIISSGCVSFLECSRVFHAGGARLVLCGRTWEKLEALYDALITVTDPSTVCIHGLR